MAHRVRHHKWENGLLKTFDTFFDEMIDAMDFAKSQDAGVVKVYHENGELVHSSEAAPANTYA